MTRESAVEGWLAAQVLPAYDALKADPSRGLTADQIRAKLGLEAEYRSLAPRKRFNI